MQGNCVENTFGKQRSRPVLVGPRAGNCNDGNRNRFGITQQTNIAQQWTLPPANTRKDNLQKTFTTHLCREKSVESLLDMHKYEKKPATGTALKGIRKHCSWKG